MATKKKTATDQTKEKKSSSGRTPTSKKTGTKTSSGKKTGNQKNNTGKSSKKRQSVEVPDISRTRKTGTPVWAEVLLWVMLAFCIILFLGTVFGAGGIIGRSISGFFFGVFGLLAYTQPFILFFITAFLIANRGSMQAWMKVLAISLLVVSLCCFFTLVSHPLSVSMTLGDYYSSCREEKNGGGMAGGMIYLLFSPRVGEIGTWICNIILFIISMVLLTGYSVFDNIRSEGGDALGQARTRKQMQRELNQQKKRRSRLQEQAKMQQEIEEIRQANHSLAKEIREPRRERIVTGVSKNTTFDMNLPAPEEVHEVVPKITSEKRTAAVLDPSRAKKAEEAVPEPEQIKSVTAKKAAKAETILENSPEKEPETVPKLNFTIQRNGSSQVISSATPVATTVSREPSLGMPEFLQEAASRKNAREQAVDVKKEIVANKPVSEMAQPPEADEMTA